MTATSPKHDTPAAIAFLQRWSPEGPWNLTAIIPDGKTETVSFVSSAWAKAATWIEERQGVKNIYFHVNPTLHGLTSKASKTDVARLAWLHIDIDPRVGEDFEEERTRALTMLRNYHQKPTVIVDSGGGFQGFWGLADDECLQIRGDVTRAEELERYNIQLEKVFQADHCHNCDRIMRLPGTINVPNKKKLAKGRKPALASVVEWNDDAVYPITSFTPAQAPNETAPRSTATKRGQAGPGDGAGTPSQWQSGSAAPFGTASLLQWAAQNGKTVSENTLALINIGTDPVDPSKYPSRSEPQFKVCCALVRAGVPDDIHYRIITDPSNQVSACILDKPNWPKYARDQIQKAHENVGNPPPILHPKTPLPSAREFIARERASLLRYNGDWLAYETAAYVELEDETVRRDLYHFLEHAKLPPSEKQREAGLDVGGDFQPDTNAVNKVVDALRAISHKPRDTFAPPCWLEGEGPPARELVACRNGLLHLPTGELHDHTPRLFTRNALTFDYDAAAATPDRWLQFLESLWPGEPDAVALLQEVFGYVLIPDTSQQKIFLMVGPTRSGKGTVARVLTELVGPRNICAPSLADFGERFGLEPLLGKQLAILSDVRLDAKANHAAIAESLLRISGEDTVTVDRKFKSAWDGRLGVRFLLLSNVMPRFSDASPALANRFVPLIMSQSFLGNEDPDLLNKLLPELPGILNWAIDGWRRLHARGRFQLPGSSRDAIQQLIELAAPVATFIREECELDPPAEVSKAELFDAWRTWCLNNNALPGEMNVFSNRLYAAASGRVGSKKGRDLEGERVPKFRGIRLKTLAAASKDPSPF